ncbi:recombinase family protein [Brucella anthropi]|uniref:recombinase family protein n=1 Tax=Brucella anthropi TaxID=529 RepID=UPI002362BA97|nr:recombinase family protein [Brucella anthropi]
MKNPSSDLQRGPTATPARLIGYARVSTDDQNLDLQLDALQSFGCIRIFEDRGLSGQTRQRSGLTKLLKTLKEGDTLVVWKLDRLGRSLSHLVELISLLRDRGVAFVSMRDQIDTNSAGGRFYFHMLAAMAEFEREIISERTKAGIAAARKRGTQIGRRPKLSEADIVSARQMLADGHSRKAIAEKLEVSVITLRQALNNPDYGGKKQRPDR